MLSHRQNPTHTKATALALGLCVLFMLMQCALSYHTAGVEKHKPGERCELCVAGANFASAVPAHAGFDPSFFHAASPPAADCVIVHSVHFVAYAVRAPPSSAA